MRQDLYYDLYVKEQDYWWHVGKRAIVYTLLRKFLHKGNRESRRALDLGCGTGLNLDHLARYAQPVGTDYYEEALRFCRQRGHTMLCKSDAAELPFDEHDFDVITALDVIEHLDDDYLAFSELRRVLRPGGILIVSVPAYPALWTYWDDILGHRRRYTTRTLAEVVAKAGLTVEKVSYSNTLTIFPAIAVRLAKAVMHAAARAHREGYQPETDFVPVPGWLNQALVLYYRLEARLLRRWGLPFGLSVVCVARRCD